VNTYPVEDGAAHQSGMTPNEHLPEPDDDSVYCALKRAEYHAQVALECEEFGRTYTEAGDATHMAFADLAFHGADVNSVVAAAYLAAAGFGDDHQLHGLLRLDWLGREP